MSTYKKTGFDGCDYAVPSRHCPPPPKPPLPPIDWGVYPFYPPYPDIDPEPVPAPPIPGRHPCPPPFVPPYPPPKPEHVDECSRKLAKLSQKTKTLVQMIKDFEDKNRPAILTIGNHSYQFGTENIVDFEGGAAKGMYANLISGEPIESLDPADYTVDSTGTRVCLKNPTDLLQSELARVRQEITLVAAAINDEVSGNGDNSAVIPGTDEG